MFLPTLGKSRSLANTYYEELLDGRIVQVIVNWTINQVVDRLTDIVAVVGGCKTGRAELFR